MDNKSAEQTFTEAAITYLKATGKLTVPQIPIFPVLHLQEYLTSIVNTINNNFTLLDEKIKVLHNELDEIKQLIKELR